jgi:hypothetical protein
MSAVDDEWESFLSQGAIILSNEKNSAKNNVTNSYQKNMDSTMTSYTAIIDTNDKTNAVLKSPTSVDTGPPPPPTPLPGLSKAKHSKKTINVSSLKIVESNLHSKKNTIKVKHSTDSSDDELGELGALGDLEELEDIDLDDYDSKIPNIVNAIVNSESEAQQPVCSNIYISTKTKISYLNEPLDIKKVFSA